MPTQEVAFSHYFADLTDPRIDRTKKHHLIDILAITLCATIAGADTWEEVERFGTAKHDWLRRFLELPNGIPSHDTLNRVFAALDPKPFADAVGRWMAAVCEATGLKQVAIDGKAVRGAPRNTFSGRLHLVSAWATENRLILGQEAVADGSHEIAAIPELLRVLDLAGALVTIDAAGCQLEIARQIRRQGGDYLLAVKGNQPTLEAAVQAVFDRACEADFAGVRYDMHATAESGHGRDEERYVTVIYEPEGLPAEWPDVAAAVLVGRERKVGGKNVSTSHYYLTSRRAKAARLGQAIRDHWGIENGRHWMLDVAFREDDNRTRAGHAGANLGLVRRLALSLLKRDSAKGSIKTKRLSAALVVAWASPTAARAPPAAASTSILRPAPRFRGSGLIGPRRFVLGAPLGVVTHGVFDPSVYAGGFTHSSTHCEDGAAMDGALSAYVTPFNPTFDVSTIEQLRQLRNRAVHPRARNGHVKPENIAHVREVHAALPVMRHLANILLAHPTFWATLSLFRLPIRPFSLKGRGPFCRMVLTIYSTLSILSTP